MTVFQNIVDGELNFPRQMQQDCRDLVKRLLERNPVGLVTLT